MKQSTSEKLQKYSGPVLRYAVSFLFFYFALNQIISPNEWIGFVPNFALVFGVSARNLVLLNAFFELALGTLLALGLYTRITSLLLSLHLFGIAASIGFNPLGVRDLTLAFATFVIFLNGPDKLCLDGKFKSDKNHQKNL